MIRRSVVASLVAMLAVSAAHGVEKKLEMDFSIAPEKINVKRITTNEKKKNELVEYSITVPETKGKDFAFQCKLIPLRIKAYAGMSVGIGNDKLAAQQLRVQLRLGDKNRSQLMFGSGSRFNHLTKMVTGIKIEPLTVIIKYNAVINSCSVNVTGASGKTVLQKDDIPLKFNAFSANSVIISVNDQIGAGESYLNYNASKQFLDGKSYMNSKYESTFAVDDVKISYTE